MVEFTPDILLDKACKAENDMLLASDPLKREQYKRTANVAFRAAMKRESDPNYSEDIIK